MKSSNSERAESSLGIGSRPGLRRLYRRLTRRAGCAERNYRRKLRSTRLHRSARTRLIFLAKLVLAVALLASLARSGAIDFGAVRVLGTSPSLLVAVVGTWVASTWLTGAFRWWLLHLPRSFGALYTLVGLPGAATAFNVYLVSQTALSLLGVAPYLAPNQGLTRSKMA
jgi:hypothetical protein